MRSPSALWSPQIIEALVPWLQAAYPEEGCGLILERASGQLEVLCCENLANTYHALDPQAYPRTASTFYMINPMEIARAERRGDRVLVIFHSHVDVGDYFSQEDIAGATLPRESASAPLEPSYPGVDYLVVSVRQGRADRAQVFRWDEASQGFVSVTTLELDGPALKRVHEGPLAAEALDAL